MIEEPLLSAGERAPAYNIHAKLDVICCKKRGERAIDVARATQIPGIMIHTALKSGQAVETKAVTTRRSKLHAKGAMYWRLGVASFSVSREFYQHPHKPSSHSAERCKVV
jgi:hypothetical protein